MCQGPDYQKFCSVLKYYTNKRANTCQSFYRYALGVQLYTLLSRKIIIFFDKNDSCACFFF